MKKLLFVFSFFFIVISGWGQDMARVRTVLDTLTSSDFQGRGYVEDGDKNAAHFIAKQFSKIGLQSFERDSYFQHFTIPINTFPGKLNLKVNDKYLTPGEDFIVDASSTSIKFKGKVYFLDTLIFYDLEAKERFLKEKCDKNVLVYRAQDLSKIFKLEEKYLQKFHCFKAYIELHKDKLTASVSTKQYPRVTFQVLEKNFPKEVSKVELEVEAAFIGQYKTQNVIGFIPGKEKPDSLIVFTAHYDHLGRMGKEVYFPGANDNASGVSMLMEFAYYYKNNPEARKYSIIFIAFAAEEAGLIGSRFFVDHPLFPLSKIKFLINLDLVGTGDDGIAVVNATIHEKEFNILNKLNSENQYFPLIKRRGEAANSDHYFFHVKGVKSFFVYTMGGTKAYHDINDKAEDLPLTKYSELFELIIDFVAAL